MALKLHAVDNPIFLGKPAWKVSAGFVVLTGLPITVAQDVRRQTQAKVFAESETFVSPQKGNLLVTGTTLNPNNDVQRKRQDKYFQEPEFFLSTQKGYNLTVLMTYAVASPTLYTVRSVFVENILVTKPQRGSLNTLGLGPTITGSADILSGQDTVGWPPDSAEPPTFVKPQQGVPVIYNGFTIYNPANDFRRSQAKVFEEPPSFPQAQKANLVLISFLTYNPNTDVIWRRPQAKVFSEPETFLSTMPRRAGSAALNYPVYNVSTDVRRALQARIFSEPEIFLRPASFNALVISGHSFIPPTPIESPQGLDIYDYMDGAVLLAWGMFVPAAQSFNIYQRSVTFRPVEQPPANAFGVSAGPYIATPGPWAQISPVFLNALNCVVSGLQIATYSSGIITPAMTYDFKVVAVISGVERGSIHKRVTPGPQSVVLTTPMKRLWPFPNTGLD